MLHFRYKINQTYTIKRKLYIHTFRASKTHDRPITSLENRKPIWDKVWLAGQVRWKKILHL